METWPVMINKKEELGPRPGGRGAKTGVFSIKTTRNRKED